VTSSSVWAIPSDAQVYVAGHRGLVGAAVWRHLAEQGFTNLLGRSSAELDLRHREATFAFMKEARPDVVVMAAARVGGIGANAAYPVDFLSDNLLIQTNVLDASHACDVDRLLFLGSSCIYPRDSPQPIREDQLMRGELESTNSAYAMAKLAGIHLVQAYRRQYGRRWISAMPTNVYGAGGDFDPRTSHVIPALIDRMERARLAGNPSVTLWGSGLPRREFVHADDLARACLVILEAYDDDGLINLGVGEDLSIRELADLIATTVGFKGVIRWDADMPDGTPRKLLDVSRLFCLGWRPAVRLEDGLRETVDWYRRQVTGVITRKS
jgi:GDP-L-fucose synthase